MFLYRNEKICIVPVHLDEGISFKSLKFLQLSLFLRYYSVKFYRPFRTLLFIQKCTQKNGLTRGTTGFLEPGKRHILSLWRVNARTTLRAFSPCQSKLKVKFTYDSLLTQHTKPLPTRCDPKRNFTLHKS